MTSLSGTIYTWKHMFSRMKIVKWKTRTRLTDTPLENTCGVQPNIDKLATRSFLIPKGISKNRKKVPGAQTAIVIEERGGDLMISK